MAWIIRDKLQFHEWAIGYVLQETTYRLTTDIRFVCETIPEWLERSESDNLKTEKRRDTHGERQRNDDIY